MKLLLDTHCWLWLFTEPDKLRADVVDMIVENNDVYVSAATAWEIVIKHALGKLSLPIAPADYVPQRMAAFGHISLAIEQRHTLTLIAFSPPPRPVLRDCQTHGSCVSLHADRRVMAPITEQAK